MEYDVNQEAPIMRAGDGFSEVNKKLRDALSSFAEWLLRCVGDESTIMAKEARWKVERPADTIAQVKLSYQVNPGARDGDGWFQVIPSSSETSMLDVINLSELLTGSAGVRLFNWLEECRKKRELLLAEVLGLTQAQEKS